MKSNTYFIVVLAIALVAAYASLSSAGPATQPAPADRAVAGPRQTVHRITGLFSRDREADLREALKEIDGVELVSLDFDHAEGTFAYDPAKAFAGTKPDKIIERFHQLLAAASHYTFGVKPLCTTPREQLTRIEIPVFGLDCKACSLGVYEILIKVDGVEQATVSFKESRVIALIDPAKTNQAAIEAVLKKHEVPLKAADGK